MGDGWYGIRGWWEYRKGVFFDMGVYNLEVIKVIYYLYILESGEYRSIVVMFKC